MYKQKDGKKKVYNKFNVDINMYEINSSTHTYIIIELKLTKLALKIR